MHLPFLCGHLVNESFINTLKNCSTENSGFGSYLAFSILYLRLYKLGQSTQVLLFLLFLCRFSSSFTVNFTLISSLAPHVLQLKTHQFCKTKERKALLTGAEQTHAFFFVVTQVYMRHGCYAQMWCIMYVWNSELDQEKNLI